MAAHDLPRVEAPVRVRSVAPSTARCSGRSSDRPFTSWASRTIPLISRGLVREDVHQWACGGTGRRAGLRSRCPQGREGSSPSWPTTGCPRCGTLATPVQIQDNAGARPPQAWTRGSSAHGERTGQARRASPLTNARGSTPWVSSTPLSARVPAGSHPGYTRSRDRHILGH